jgi:hypothetical protein
MIDEKTISSEQMRTICSIIYDRNVSDFPHPEAELLAYVRKIDELNRSVIAPPIWNPSTKKIDNWIDSKKIKSCYGKSSVCSIM